MSVDKYLVVFILVILCGCVSQSHGKQNKKGKKSFNVLTFNAMLQESRYELYVTKPKRKEKLMKALKSTSADVVCLQEIFHGHDVEDIIKSVRKQFPYTFSGLHEGINKFPPQQKGKRRPPCDQGRLDDFLACINVSNCQHSKKGSSYNSGLHMCTKIKCVQEMSQIFKKDNSACLNCLASSFFNLNHCASKSQEQGGRQMNVGGLVLLSKNRMSDVSFNNYHPKEKVFWTKGYLKADIKDVATVFCTSLSNSYESFLEFEMTKKKKFSSYGEMNTYQTKKLITSVQNTKKAIILGDFNSGQRFEDGQFSILKENYVRLLQQFPTMPAIKETYRRNTLAAYSYVIDHVFAKNMILHKTERVFVSEKDEETAISEHVGVQTLIEPSC